MNTVVISPLGEEGAAPGPGIRLPLVSVTRPVIPCAIPDEAAFFDDEQAEPVKIKPKTTKRIGFIPHFE